MVGRTRFCIHPHDRAGSIPAVGGTKNVDLEKLKSLKPDLIVLDREENTREMAEALKGIASLHVSHVTDVATMPSELDALASAIGSTAVQERLQGFATRYREVLAKPRMLHNGSSPGSVVYCIWKEPWMAVGPNTFIASMLEQAGYDPATLWPRTSEKYPKFKPADVPADALILLSSEPYPFGLRPPTEFGSRPQALVDGESYSWFGLRSLRFLEALKGHNSARHL